MACRSSSIETSSRPRCHGTLRSHQTLILEYRAKPTKAFPLETTLEVEYVGALVPELDTFCIVHYCHVLASGGRCHRRPRRLVDIQYNFSTCENIGRPTRRNVSGKTPGIYKYRNDSHALLLDWRIYLIAHIWRPDFHTTLSKT